MPAETGSNLGRTDATDPSPSETQDGVNSSSTPLDVTLSPTRDVKPSPTPPEVNSSPTPLDVLSSLDDNSLTPSEVVSSPAHALSSKRTAKKKKKKKKASKRGQWGSHIDFVLACIGYAVGLGNVFRFPYLVYDNGGGVFLIPYAICTLTAGLPALYMEFLLGQYSGVGPNQLFGKFGPLFRGVGWAMVAVSCLMATYYNMVMAYTLIYFVMSFRTDLLWRNCAQSWNTPYCLTDLDEKCTEQVVRTSNSSNSRGIVYGDRCYEADSLAFQQQRAINGNVTVSPAEEFFRRFVLGLTTSTDNPMGDIGGLQWPLMLALFVSWLIVFAILVGGVRSTGRLDDLCWA